MLKYIYILFLLLMIGKLTYAQITTGREMLPADSLIFDNDLKKLDKRTLDVLPVSGQPFMKSYQISNFDRSDNKDVKLSCTNLVGLQKGDILLLSFYTRSIKTIKETGESFLRISLDRTIAGKYDWPPIIERGISFGKNWTFTQIPLTASRDVQSGDLCMVVQLANYPQSVQIGGMSLINYRQSLKLTDLPKTVVHYDGDAADAAWRKAAALRIEKYRKANLTVSVLNREGKPVENAKVTVRLKKNAFGFGTAVNSSILMDSLSIDAKKYRDTLLAYYNKVVFENETKSKNWAGADHKRTIKAIGWLKQHDIDVRGHVMVWPSWQHSPQFKPYKTDTAGLRSAILAQIDDETSVLKGSFKEWDVLNEPYAHHEIIDLLGRQTMIDWFNRARIRAPGVKLFLNDYTMFQGEGPESPSEKFFDNVKFLKDHKAPVDMIGEQAHIGGSPPGIPYVLSRLERFSQLGLPMQISEFDITSDDDDFKAKYLNDFMTAIFSYPTTIGFIQWGFWEGAHWIPTAALWDKSWTPRKHGTVYKNLVTKTWSTNVVGTTGQDGKFSVRGFTGDYDVEIVVGRNKYHRSAVLTTQGENITIKL